MENPGIKKNKRGFTLVDMIIAVAILGIIMLIVPITLRILDNLRYEQEFVRMQTEARNFLQMFTHELENSPKVETIMGNPNKVTVYQYDFEVHGTGSEELIKKTRLGTGCDGTPGTHDNWVKLTYEVINEEDPQTDIDGNAKIANHILKTTQYFIQEVDPKFGRLPVAGECKRTRTYLEGWVVPADVPKGERTFSFPQVGAQGSDTLDIALRMKLPFRGKHLPPKKFTSVVALRGPASSWGDD